jgi:hypothetical protein
LQLINIILLCRATSHGAEASTKCQPMPCNVPWSGGLNQMPTYAAQRPMERRPQPYRDGSLKFHKVKTVLLLWCFKFLGGAHEDKARVF